MAPLFAAIALSKPFFFPFPFFIKLTGSSPDARLPSRSPLRLLVCKDPISVEGDAPLFRRDPVCDLSDERGTSLGVYMVCR